MKIHFYGTGASEGFPAMFCDCPWCEEARRLGGRNIRTRSSCGIDDALLIDFSGDSYAHALYGGLDMRRIRQLLFTHSHSDHFYPQDLLTILPPMAWRRERAPLDVYGPASCTEKLRQAAGRRDISADLRLHALDLWKTVPVGAYQVTPLKACHDPDELCFIHVIRGGGKTLLYGHDSAMFGEETWAALRAFRFDCVVLDCTSVLEPHVFDIHMGFDENVRIRQRMLRENMADAGTRFVATHFAHTYGPLHDRLTEAFAGEGFIAAWDGLELTV